MRIAWGCRRPLTACARCALPHCATQVVEEGYEFFAKRQLVTIFSAPNYCGEFENAGAMMSVDETLMCSFQVRACVWVCVVKFYTEGGRTSWLTGGLM